jgi:hypothetical protein
MEDNTDRIPKLKKEIKEAWVADRPRALDLYGELVGLSSEKGEDVSDSGFDEALIRRIVEQLMEKGEFPRELSDRRIAAHAVAHLKRCVDELRWNDNAKSAEYANAIVRIGEAGGDAEQVALGLMSLGDSIAISGERLDEAWDLQRKSAELFLGEGNIIGWARTVIGMIGICMELKCADETLGLANTALSVFRRFGERDFFVRLAINMIRLLNEIGSFESVIPIFDEALRTAQSLSPDAGQHLLLLHNNIAITYWNIGELGKSKESLIAARDYAVSVGKKESVSVILTNLAFLENMRGNYNEALAISGSLTGDPEKDATLYGLRIRRLMAECLLNLNRDDEALASACAIIEGLSKPGVGNEMDLGHTLRMKGTALAKLGMLSESAQSLCRAWECYLAMKSERWAKYTDMLIARVLYEKGEHDACLSKVRELLPYFEENLQRMNHVRGLLLEAESLIGLSRFGEALSIGKALLGSVAPDDFFGLCYGAYIVTGRAEEGLGNPENAKLHLNDAFRMVETLQRNLALTIKSGFLEDKCEAVHGLMRIYLAGNEIDMAFETVERLKSMTVLGYLANRKRIFWSCKDSESIALIEELAGFRNEYNGLYSMYQEKPLLDAGDPSPAEELIVKRLRACEERIAKIVERLYLVNAKEGYWSPATSVSAAAVRERLDPDTVLVEYYVAGGSIWAFILDCGNTAVRKLGVSVNNVCGLVEKLYDNVDYAISCGARSDSSDGLLRIVKKICGRLYDALIAPLELGARGAKKLVIVPFGSLHYVPYNILFDGVRFLVETHDLSVLPAGSLLTRPYSAKPRGMNVLAYSAGGRLSATKTEAACLHALISGALFVDESATSACLAPASVQILHIAAHGKHRTDSPGMSYIELTDGILYTDDLLQMDLDYELVTLSACETGRLRVKKSEEMIGLIRGFLFAGAQSMVVSMWRIDDEMTEQLMMHFYTALVRGNTKAHALAQAQRKMVEENPNLHPAFWGAFQLIGHAGPLSS